MIRRLSVSSVQCFKKPAVSTTNMSQGVSRGANGFEAPTVCSEPVAKEVDVVSEKSSLSPATAAAAVAAVVEELFQGAFADDPSATSHTERTSSAAAVAALSVASSKAEAVKGGGTTTAVAVAGTTTGAAGAAMADTAAFSGGALGPAAHGAVDGQVEKDCAGGGFRGHVGTRVAAAAIPIW